MQRPASGLCYGKSANSRSACQVAISKIEIAAAKAREPRRRWLSDYSNLRDSGLSGKISRPPMGGASAANVWRDTVILRALSSVAPTSGLEEGV